MNAYPIKFFKDWRGNWRWRIKATNGKIISASTESYKNRIDCESNARMTGLALSRHFGCNNIDCSFEEVKP